MRGPDFTSSILIPSELMSCDTSGPLKDHADRAGDGVAAGDDVVGGDGGDIAAGSGDVPMTETTGFLAAIFADRLEIASDPAVVPPGLSMSMITAFTRSALAYL